MADEETPRVIASLADDCSIKSIDWPLIEAIAADFKALGKSPNDPDTPPSVTICLLLQAARQQTINHMIIAGLTMK